VSIALKLEGVTDILDLNTVLTTGSGYQALVGATGLGLPPVTVQWVEGAGDGAGYRGRRVRSRVIDLPIDVVGINRTHLKTLLSRLAKVLAEPCNLVIVEDGTEWFASVVREGGGGFAYGTDTVGERDVQVILSLTAGDPYFTSRVVTSQNVAPETVTAFLDAPTSMPVGSGQTIGFINIENTGDATAYPVWTVHGPGNNFQAVSPSGETLSWTGTLTTGQILTLDTRKGTVKLQDGTNKYADLAAAPRFWSVPPGITTCTVALAGTDSNSKIVCSWQARKWLVI